MAACYDIVVGVLGMRLASISFHVTASFVSDLYLNMQRMSTKVRKQRLRTMVFRYDKKSASMKSRILQIKGKPSKDQLEAGHTWTTAQITYSTLQDFPMSSHRNRVPTAAIDAQPGALEPQGPPAAPS